MPTYKPKIKIRKFKGNCELCNKKLNEKEAFIYVDGNNHSVTLNSPYLCLKCYLKRYGDK